MNENLTYTVKPGAEKVVNAIAVINLVIGIAAFVIMTIVSYSIGSWATFGIGAGVLVTGVVGWAFLKVMVNISRSLYNITTELQKCNKEPRQEQ